MCIRDSARINNSGRLINSSNTNNCDSAENSVQLRRAVILRGCELTGIIMCMRKSSQLFGSDSRHDFLYGFLHHVSAFYSVVVRRFSAR